MTTSGSRCHAHPVNVGPVGIARRLFHRLLTSRQLDEEHFRTHTDQQLWQDWLSDADTGKETGRLLERPDDIVARAAAEGDAVDVHIPKVYVSPVYPDPTTTSTRCSTSSGRLPGTSRSAGAEAPLRHESWRGTTQIQGLNDR